MNVLLIGSGGREHALAWKMAQSPKLTRLFIAPGNAGTGALGTNIDLNPLDFEAVKQFCIQSNIQMVVVGPEEPLVMGISDYFSSSAELKHIPVIGPSKAGATLEGSKDFSKQFMARHGIPTARYRSFHAHQVAEAQAALKEFNPPYVLKASGLAAGKGVVILDDLGAAQAELASMFSGKFGSAGETVVIEEFLAGIEFSVFVLTDGKDYILLPEAKDYKRIGEGDTGLNTGGMGAVSPVSFCTPDLMEKVKHQIVLPTLSGLQKENIPYTGFIFFGLILVNNNPFVIEYNVRLGDPETEVVIPRLKNDLLECFELAGKGQLNQIEVEHDSRTATTVMAVSGGYPEAYAKGKPMQLPKPGGNTQLLFHAGTARAGEQIVTSGGRVVAATSLATGLQDALDGSYALLQKISFDGMYYRQDIGRDLLKLER